MIVIDKFIKEFNQQAHIDIEEDIQKRRNGLFTFVIRIDSERITDYTVLQYIDARQYIRPEITKVVVAEFTSTRNNSSGSESSPLGADNIQR